MRKMLRTQVREGELNTEPDKAGRQLYRFPHPWRSQACRDYRCPSFDPADAIANH